MSASVGAARGNNAPADESSREFGCGRQSSWRPAARPAVHPDTPHSSPATCPRPRHRLSTRLLFVGDFTMIWLLWLPVTLAAPGVFPLVDPGLFVISGVRTCGGGAGYCLLGLDCTLDEDFLPDDGAGQHCEGLRSAFTPSAHFVCCRAANYKPPAPPATTAPLEVLENEVESVLQKVAESVEAAQRTPAPGAELRDTLLEEEALESSIEGGVLQAGDDSEEEMQHDEQYKETSYEQEHASVEEELYQNDSPSEAVNIPQEPKIEESSEEKSTEENSISSNGSESSEEEESSSSEEVDSEELLTTTNKSQQKPPPFEERPPMSETQNDLKVIVEKDGVENNAEEEGIVDEDKVQSDSEGDVTERNDIHLEETATTTTASPDEDVTEHFMSKETLSVYGENDLEMFQNDEKTKQPFDETSNPGIQGSNSKNQTSTVKHDTPNDHIVPQNTTHVNANPVKTKTKPQPGKKPTNKDASKISAEDSSLNEVVLTTTTTLDKKSEPNSLHNALYGLDKQVDEDGIRTNKTNANSQTNTKAGFATESSVNPAQDTDRPGSQGHCANTNTNTNCSREIRFVFQNRTLCFGSVYSLDWVVTSASCALRIFRAGMLNVSVTPLEGSSGAGEVKTIVVHESYAENAGLSGQHMEANNIGVVQLRTSMREWAGCVSCLPQAGHNLTSNCSALTDHPMATPSPKCSTPESCKGGRSESTLSRCQGRARDMKDEVGFHYLTIACDTLWQPRLAEPPHGSGAPLFCGDVLAGLEASAGMGLMVYTPVSRYTNWLQHNTRATSPQQHFNLH